MTTFSTNMMTMNNLPQSNFLPLDLNFINNPKYQDLSTEAMLLHALYTMRMTCSIHNSKKDGSWLDDEKQPFIYFSNSEAADLLRISERKVTKLRNDLVSLDLIQVVRHGLKNYRIYVSNPEKAPENISVKLVFKNYSYKKAIGEAAVRDAKSASTQTQNLLTSTEKTLAKTLTSETSTTVGVAASAVVDKEASLIEGLKSRYAHLIPNQAFQRFLPFCDNSYLKAKEVVDIIFKAKFVSNQNFIKAGLPAETAALTFESNPYFKNGMPDALAKAYEQMYRYQHVDNPSAFLFSFMRGYFTEKTRQYLSDHYEIAGDLSLVFERMQQKKNKNRLKNRNLSVKVC